MSTFSTDSGAPLELPRRIGINAVFLEPRMGGLDTFVRALVPELARQAPEVQFSVFCNSRGRDYLYADGLGESAELLTHPLLGRRGLKAASELLLLGALADRRVDLLHSAGMTGPLRMRAAHVLTLPDVTWIVAPDRAEIATARLWRLIVPPVARRADRVLAQTQAAADHIVEYIHVDPRRIDIVPIAAGVSARSAPTPEPELRERLRLPPGRVVLTVSAKKANKNLERLVRAMVPVAERVPDALLVMPGNPTPHEQELRALAARLGLQERVFFPGYVSDGELEGLYSMASCFVFASINEGFGIPILEAMRRGVPVACSRASCLPEVAGEAAVYFDPYEVHDLAAAVVRVLEDVALASELSAAGRARERLFSWERTARETLESYSRAYLERGLRTPGDRHRATVGTAAGGS